VSFGIVIIAAIVDSGTMYSCFPSIHYKEMSIQMSLLTHIIIYSRAFYRPYIIFVEKNCMEMVIDFPGGSRVDAHFGDFTVATDQPPVARAPSPFEIFLASIGTCAGIYVLGFCQSRHLPTEGISIVERINHNHITGMVETIGLEIQVPPEFPEKYLDSLIRSAELCAVKKHLEKPPRFEITTAVVSPSVGA
jgi:ribosomal protein S12 methylthiotransferase accessory factor